MTIWYFIITYLVFVFTFIGHLDYFASQTSLDHAYVSQNSLNQPNPPHDVVYNFNKIGSVYSSHSQSINSLAHSNLGRPSPATSNMSINSSDRRLMQVPSYRPSPDYEVAVLRQRRRYSNYLDNVINPGNQLSSHPTSSKRSSYDIYFI